MKRILYFLLLLIIVYILGANGDPTFIPLPDNIWWLQNHESAILEGDTFTIFSFDSPYMSLWIDDHKYKPLEKDDKETEQIVRSFMRQEAKNEVFLNSFAIPILKAGIHEFRISLSHKTTSGAKKAYPDQIIRFVLNCVPIPLLFFPGETCECRLDATSIEMTRRPEWMRQMLEKT